jgi:hypothetical protein
LTLKTFARIAVKTQNGEAEDTLTESPATVCGKWKPAEEKAFALTLTVGCAKNVSKCRAINATPKQFTTNSLMGKPCAKNVPLRRKTMIKNTRMVGQHRDDIAEWINSFTDDTDRAIAIGWIIERQQEDISRLSAIRHDLVRRMRNEGRSIRRIAADLGVSSTRIEQLSR